MKTALSVYALSGVLFAGASGAATLTVPGDHSTIQNAINAAASGDIVLVTDGTYPERIDFSGKDVIVESENGPSVTTIDGGATGSVVTFNGGESRDAVLRGFTITNGSAFEGSGVLITSGSPTIEDNVITNNQGCRGSGIAVAFSPPLIQNNVISNNTDSLCPTGTGGGVSVRGASLTVEIRNNVISGNTAYNGAAISSNSADNLLVSGNEIRDNVATNAGAGGSMYFINGTRAVVENNLFIGNTSPNGTIYWSVSSSARGPKFYFNTFYGNSGGSASAIYARGFDGFAEVTSNVIIATAGESAIFCAASTDAQLPVFTNNLVLSDTGLEYDGLCADQTDMNGNISVDPQFADPNAHDFRLLPTSPALDVALDIGTVMADYQANPRPVDANGDMVATSDIGALEAQVPTADAGADQNVDAGAVVMLDGSASADLDGTIVTYSWMQTGGTAITFSDATAVMPSFDAPGAADTLMFDMTATDDLGFLSIDSVLVTVNAPPPPPPPPPRSGGGGQISPLLLLLLTLPTGIVLLRRLNATG